MSGAAITMPYRHCEAVTRRRARNFYYGIRLLPPSRRPAMCAIYSFARRIDDIADGPDSAAVKLSSLADARRDLHRLGSPTHDRVMLALADAATRFPIPLDAFDDLIDGARMDVLGARYERYADLIVYCRRVAGSIGRLSLGVFGCTRREDAVGYADDLGVAMQLTNILRDISEDFAAGRVYLPEEDLQAFDCDVADPGRAGALAELVRFEAVRAHDWFDLGRRLLPSLDRPSAACVGTIAGTYERLLRRIERNPKAVMEGRVRVPAWSKLWIATRAVTGASR